MLSFDGKHRAIYFLGAELSAQARVGVIEISLLNTFYDMYALMICTNFASFPSKIVKIWYTIFAIQGNKRPRTYHTIRHWLCGKTIKYKRRV